jgi:hypothetical protein
MTTTEVPSELLTPTRRFEEAVSGSSLQLEKARHLMAGRPLQPGARGPSTRS